MSSLSKKLIMKTIISRGGEYAVAIVGTRSPSAEQIRSCRENAQFLDSAGIRLISGGAKGVDTIAEREIITGPKRIFTATDIEAYNQGLRSDYKYENLVQIAEEAHPNWPAVIGKGPYVVNLMIRNVLIALHSNLVIAYPGESGGTWHTIKAAEILGVPVDINPGIEE
jgi:predicted Rossmann fold nucleotide-binding protein DprA/Smf involved in DNA uptake